MSGNSLTAKPASPWAEHLAPHLHVWPFQSTPEMRRHASVNFRGMCVHFTRKLKRTGTCLPISAGRLKWPDTRVKILGRLLIFVPPERICMTEERGLSTGLLSGQQRHISVQSTQFSHDTSFITKPPT